MKTEREVSFVSMPEDEDWLLRPVLQGLCRYESLIDGSLSLEDIAVMNDALDVQAENEDRYREANST